MTDKHDGTRQQQYLGNLMNGMAEHYLRLNDDRLIDEYGSDGDEIAGNTHKLMKDKAKAYRQRRLIAAAQEYAQRNSEMDTLWVELPDSPEERRSLLAFALAHNPSMEKAFLTLQHRKLTELSDADVESCLVQLSELGVLGNIKDNDD